MSYQVLARKWRPARFQEMVGQEHVLKALVNALDDDRLHHAYLFTGTRGVGKTSIARLFAKSLNCETGVSSSPCGECSACREISEGRFVDLIEVDAASRTKVEDTRELLENVQYAPTHGRFKVYLIDEVHMLSTHSFNALLKTLEEPPPHVKFLLATTDPQKLPVTILSRCLQFNLKNMIPERIVDHLSHVLTQESISFEEPALWLLARSADGSMRDAMSLTDQAIAFGAGEVNEADVRAMLGTIDQRLVYRLVDCLAVHNAAELLKAVEDLSRFSPDYNTVLGDLISLLHRIALAQIVPDAVDNGLGDREQVLDLAGKLTAEDVQLFYQTALVGRKDLPFVPDAREGVEMILLRMLAFRPASVPTTGLSQQSAAQSGSAAPADDSSGTSQMSQAVEAAPAQAVAAEPEPQSDAPAPVQPAAEPTQPAIAPAAPPMMESAPPAAAYDDSYLHAGMGEPAGFDEGPDAKKSEADVAPPEVAAPPAIVNSAVPDLPWEEPAAPAVSQESVIPEPVAEPERADIPSAAVTPPVLPASVAIANVDDKQQVSQSLADFTEEQWVLLVDLIGLTGMTYSIAANTSLEKTAGGWLFHYTQQQQAMLGDVHIERIRNAIGDYFATPIEVEFALGDYSRETPSQYRARKRAERQVMAVESIQNDPVVQTLVERFSGRIDLDSVQPID